MTRGVSLERKDGSTVTREVRVMVTLRDADGGSVAVAHVDREDVPALDADGDGVTLAHPDAEPDAVGTRDSLEHRDALATTERE